GPGPCRGNAFLDLLAGEAFTGPGADRSTLRRGAFALRRVGDSNADAAVMDADVDQRARLQHPFHEQRGDRQGDPPPDLTLDPSAAVTRIEPGGQDMLDDIVVDVDDQVSSGNPLALENRLQIDPGNPDRLLMRQRVEQHDVLKAVEELGPEMKLDGA